MGGGQKGELMVHKEVWKTLEDEGWYIQRSKPRRDRYIDDRVIDENKSVKWNREQIAKRNEELEAKYAADILDREVRYAQWVRDVCHAIQDEVGNKMTYDQAMAVCKAMELPNEVDGPWWPGTLADDIQPFVDLAKELLSDKE